MSAIESFDPSQFDRWDEKTQRLAAEQLQRRVEGRIRVFYCTRGRECDGKPHDAYTWRHARGDQWPPPGDDWFVWLVISGRGSGKTRTGSEWVRKMSEKVPAIALIGRTGNDIRDTMVEGEPTENGSGLIKACERAGLTGYLWEPSKKLFTFPNGAQARGFSGEEPDTLRGKQFGAAWVDEPAHIDLIDEVWKMLKLTLRMRTDAGRAKVLCTSTPKPIPWVKDLVKKPSTRLVRVSTYVNLENLDEAFAEQILSDYEGTRLGRQELHGEILEDVEGAMWTHDMIHDNRAIGFDQEVTPLDRIVVGVDPAGSNVRRSDETGLIVVGKRGNDFYVLEDRSGKYTPQGWASLAWDLYETWQADKIVAEKNFGGSMVEQTLQNAAAGRALALQLVVSRRGKAVRAEPVAGLYEQGRVHHVKTFETLEEQMTEWVPGEGSSPDRVDALVHAVLALSGGSGPAEIAAPVRTVRPGGNTPGALLHPQRRAGLLVSRA